jgi:phage anti-repressor protein
MELSAGLVRSMVESGERFSVDFDDAWKWVGYTTKYKAKEKLVSTFEEGIDFSTKGWKTPSGGRPREQILLTIDCFKMFCMMAGTAKGKEVRLYFLECEKQLKDKNKHRVVKVLISDTHAAWAKRFEDEFFEEVYRITGWKAP